MPHDLTTESIRPRGRGIAKDMTGHVIGRWTVVALAGRTKHGALLWECLCECGTRRDVSGQLLRNGESRSCGCAFPKGKQLHGDSDSKLYHAYKDMRDRCSNPRRVGYKDYGARGIVVAECWRHDYIAFREWAMKAGYQDGLTIERKDVDGPYSPDNCCWIPRSEQNWNRTDTFRLTAFGETKTLREWTLDTRCRVSYGTLHSRLYSCGWASEKAIATPPTKLWSGRFKAARPSPQPGSREPD